MLIKRDLRLTQGCIPKRPSSPYIDTLIKEYAARSALKSAANARNANRPFKPLRVFTTVPFVRSFIRDFRIKREKGIEATGMMVFRNLKICKKLII